MNRNDLPRGELRPVNEIMDVLFSIIEIGKNATQDLTINDTELLSEVTNDAKRIYSASRSLPEIMVNIDDSELTKIGFEFAKKLKNTVLNGNSRSNK